MSKRRISDKIYYWGHLPEGELNRDGWGCEYLYVSRDLERCRELAGSNSAAGSNVYRVTFTKISAAKRGK